MKQQIIQYFETQGFTKNCQGILTNEELEISIFENETENMCFVKCKNLIFNSIEVWSFWTSSYEDFINKYKILTYYTQDRYTKNEIEEAGRLGEISMIDVKHLISLLNEAK